MPLEIKTLQDHFAIIDLMTTRVRGGLLEVLIKKLMPLKIKMYQEKHQTPHVHIDYGTQKHKASYSVIDGQRLAGNLDDKYDNAVRTWIVKHHSELLTIWKALQAGNQKVYELKIGSLKE